MKMFSSLWLLAFTASSSLLLQGCSAGSFLKNATSHVNIQIPTSLHSNSGYPHSLAKFGSYFDFWSPAGTLAERVVYDARYGKLCHLPKSNDTKTFVHPFIMLVDRGDCTFVEKVRRAQQLGASAVLIANQDCLCGEPNCTDDGGSNEKCQDDLPIVADDGSGADVGIPSVVLQKTDAEAIKKSLLLKENSVVLAELSWHAPKYESSVTLDFFHTPVSNTAMTFLTNFSKVVTAMGDQLNFHPHYTLLDGDQLGCVGKAGKEGDACYDLCTNHGRYCSVSHHGISGKDAVTESLRRMCIWKHNAPALYWDYLDHFVSWCQSSDFFGNADCIQDAYTHSSVDKTVVEDCMKDSGDILADDTNSLLQQALVASMEYGVHSTPAVFLNELPMRYTLGPRTVLEGLCMGFDHGLGPHVCFACGSCGDPVACASRSPMQCLADDGKDKEKPKSKTDTGGDGSKKKRHVFRWIFFFMLFGGAGGYVYYKKFVEEEDGGGAYSLAEAFMGDDTA
jgi:hypothetical protein